MQTTFRCQNSLPSDVAFKCRLSISIMMMTLVLQYGSSSLMVASREGHLDVVIALIEGGANVNKTNKVGIHGCTLFLYSNSIPIVHHPYTHGDHPSLLYTWGPSIPIVHMGTIHPYCTHGDHPSLCIHARRKII